MGIVTRKNMLFLNVTCGVMRNKEREIETGGYEGYLTGIREREDEFEGKVNKKIEIRMKDISPESDEVACISFTKEGWYALSFFARIKNINIEKPFVLGVLGTDKNEKMSFCYLKQEGIKKVEKDPGFPKYEKVKVSGKEVLDWTEPFAAMDAIVGELQEQLKAETPAEEVHEAEEKVSEPAGKGGKKPVNYPVRGGEGDDDLPF